MFKKKLLLTLIYSIVFNNILCENNIEDAIENDSKLFTTESTISQDKDIDSLKDDSVITEEVITPDIQPLSPEEVNEFFASLNEEERAAFDKFLEIFKTELNQISSTKEYTDFYTILKNRNLALNIGIQFSFNKKIS